MITSLYTLYWEYNWDWGLFDRDLPGARFLRDKLVFSPSTYYIAMFFNTVIRFDWLIIALNLHFSGPLYFLENLEMIIFLRLTIESIRRTVWAILRVENEYFNNFE